MSKKWFIRNYEEGDEEKICELMDVVYGKWQGIHYWNWKYKNNPAGFHNDCIIVAEHDDKIIGTFALLPVKMKIENKQILGSQGVDLATHPDYLRQGVFESMATKLYTDAGSGHIPLTYAFPGTAKRPTAFRGAAYKGHEKMGWFRVCWMIAMIKIVNYKTYLKKPTKTKYLDLARQFFTTPYKIRESLIYSKKTTDVIIKTIKRFDKRINDFWNNFSKNYENIVVRDQEHLNWRTNCPTTEYTIFQAEKDDLIIGYLVLNQRREEDFASIVDLLVLPNREKVLSCLISKAIMYCKAKGISALHFIIPPTYGYYKILKGHGFFGCSTSMGFLVRINLSKFETYKDVLSKPKNWFITMCDGDQI